MRTPRIAIFSDSASWHERRLAGACARRGADARIVSLRDCRLATEAPQGLLVPEFEDGLPDAAFVRCVPGGSFEQVSLRLDFLHALEALRIPVFNGARAIERTVDKGMTSWLLQQAGIATPPAWICESAEAAARIHRRETAAGHRLVLKPLFGNRGRGLALLDAGSRLPDADACAGVYYLQRFIEGPGPTPRDWRVMVIGGRAVAAMERISQHWITNRARGAWCVAAALNADLATLAEAATAAVGASYAGVDIARDRDGACLVLEVNGVPAWSGLQQVTPVDVADRLIEALLREIGAAPLEAVS
jgi:RimK family alpha-L-glutamate ligase